MGIISRLHVNNLCYTNARYNPSILPFKINKKNEIFSISGEKSLTVLYLFIKAH